MKPKELSTAEIDTLIKMFIDQNDFNRAPACPDNVTNEECSTLTMFNVGNEEKSCAMCWRAAARRKKENER